MEYLIFVLIAVILTWVTARTIWFLKDRHLNFTEFSYQFPTFICWFMCFCEGVMVLILAIFIIYFGGQLVNLFIK